MTHCIEHEEHLNDLADGLLPLPRRREVEQHLEGCAGCRRFLEDLRSLQEGTGELPRSVEPPRDLWPGIEPALRSRGSAAGLATPRRLAVVWRVALPAAAAGLLMVLTAWVTIRLVEPGGEPGTPGGSVLPAGTSSLQGFRTAEVEYGQATDDLLAILEERRGELSPETIAVVEENLHIINQAIRDAWAALESDPAQLGNGSLVTSLYRKKVALLEQAVNLPAES